MILSIYHDNYVRDYARTRCREFRKELSAFHESGAYSVQLSGRILQGYVGMCVRCIQKANANGPFSIADHAKIFLAFRAFTNLRGY